MYCLLLGTLCAEQKPKAILNGKIVCVHTCLPCTSSWSLQELTDCYLPLRTPAAVQIQELYGKLQSFVQKTYKTYGVAMKKMKGITDVLGQWSSKKEFLLTKLSGEPVK